MNLIKVSLLLLGSMLLLNSCGSDEPLPTLEEYIATNNLNTQSTASGLHYIIETQGTAPNPTLTSTITIAYKGYLLNGDEFDSSDNATFPLNGLIQGWQEGIQLIGTGGKIRLFIPSNLAYGSRGASTIPPNTDIGFDITLFSHQ